MHHASFLSVKHFNLFEWILLMSYVPPNTPLEGDPLLNAKEVAIRLGVSEDWVWDHSTRRAPFLPSIWLSAGALRFRRSAIDSFVRDRERLSRVRVKRR